MDAQGEAPREAWPEVEAANVLQPAVHCPSAPHTDAVCVLDLQAAGIVPHWKPNLDSSSECDFIGFGSQSHFRGRDACKEVSLALVVAVAASIPAFGAGVAIFKLCLQGPHAEGGLAGDDISNGFAFWTSCNESLANSTSLQATPLGQALPLGTVKVRISGLKHWSMCLVAGLLVHLLLEDSLAAFAASALCGVLCIMSTLHTIYAWFELPGLTSWDAKDQLVSMILLMVPFSVLWLRTKMSDLDTRARCPRTLLYGTLFVSTIAAVVMMTLMYYMTHMDQSGLGIMHSVAVCMALLKTLDFFVRWLFRRFLFPALPYVCVSFMYEISILYVIKRGVILAPGFEDVFGATLATAGLELASNVIGVLLCVYRYNACALRGDKDLARQQINIAVWGILSDVFAEHVALQASLSLIATDPRIFDTQVVVADVWLSWSVQFVAECVVDTLSLLFLLRLLPVHLADWLTPSADYRRLAAGVAFYTICSGVTMHTLILHMYVTEGNFKCA
eukprot:TRINITY_DN50865_c0_g1_i1.p1 TRINITY_DN50865_c0_g1~~TRINITY_DN50865_c0_g1_i1.p1  ORF type:complete len:504 (-),score=46.40 TRINITY_DN50865_c0_g1_i1:314-1825(-)